MTAAKHTPGPWFSEYDDNGFYEIKTQADVAAWLIAFTRGESEQDEANARLIAAAPELLEALQRLLPAYREAVKLWDSNHDDAFTVAAHNAIAKATGEAA